MPDIEQAPWLYQSPQGPTYFKGGCIPVAVVLHRLQGYYRTAREWALAGHYGASWHYTIDHDGAIMQHLQHSDGGYQAGIPATAPNPTWPLWRGHGQNCNLYTLGIEMAGFAGEPHTPEQLASLKWLCQKLAIECGFAYERENFPAHAEIDVVNRFNDFNTPAIREEVYAYLFQEEDMELKERLERLELAVMAGGEEHGTYAEKLELAAYRIGLRIEGENGVVAQGLVSEAASASASLAAHLAGNLP